jgi:hypothetical protein
MNQTNKTLPLWQVLLCGAAIVTLSMGVRHGFGLWLQPITQAQNWTRENFAFAMAIQNLTWGFFSIFSGMVADKFGAFRVIVGSCGYGVLANAHAFHAHGGHFDWGGTGWYYLFCDLRRDWT